MVHLSLFQHAFSADPKRAVAEMTWVFFETGRRVP